MARAHLFRPVTDESGNLLYGAVVTVLKSDSSALIAQPIYDSFRDTANVLANPITIASGFIDIWLDTPERVGLLIQSVGRADIAIYLDAQPPAPEVVRSASPLTITNEPMAGTVLTGIDGLTASWRPLPAPPVGVVPVHYHQGAGANSVALGTGAVSPGASSTAVGDISQALADQSTAYGQNAQAAAIGSTALGASSRAQGDNSTAVGFSAIASQASSTAVGASAVVNGAQSTGVGAQAQALGTSATAMGYHAVAQGDDSVALGANAQAMGVNATAIGAGASATFENSVAIGAGAVANAENEIALGTAAHDIVVLGTTTLLGDAHLGSADGVLAFFGSTGATRQVVSGSDNGDLTLRSLLASLAEIGLIDNQSTQG